MKFSYIQENFQKKERSHLDDSLTDGAPDRHINRLEGGEKRLHIDKVSLQV